MRKKHVTLFCACLLGIVGVSSVFVHAQETSDPEQEFSAMFAPFQEVLDEFNATHGTSYSVVNQEELDHLLESEHKTKEEFYQDMIDHYSKMTPEEFNAQLEQTYEQDIAQPSAGIPTQTANTAAYFPDSSPAAEHLPYFNQTEPTKKVVSSSQINASLFRNLSQ